MKARQLLRRSAAVSFLLLNAVTASAAIFTTDTYISATNLSNDGQDVVVTNCTLTVDGPHGFNSLQIQNGGVLTHSAFTNGPQQATFAVSDEMQTLSVSNLATLLNSNVDTSTIVVMDLSSTITYTQNVDYVVLSSPPYTQLQLTTNSAIAEGTNVLVSYNWLAGAYQGFSLIISNNAQVLAGGAVNLAGKGYAGGSGPGAGTSRATNYPFAFTAGGGAGHGGCGGMSSTFAPGGTAYDSTTNPAALGSSGGTGSFPGGAGGGLAQLFVGGLLQVDGQIVADGLTGTNSHSGAGAGGGLLLSAQTFSGAGTITANGGAGDSPDGGGGGGRIAIFFATNNFTGNTFAFGGAGANYGGAGTIFLRSFTNPAGQLLIANGGTPGTNTLFLLPPTAGTLTVSSGAIAQPQTSSFTISNLFIGSNSALLSPVGSALTLAVNGNAIIQPGGALRASFAPAAGSGAGGSSCNVGTGGGYGGFGGPGGACGRVGGTIYGSFTQPTALGSSGGASPALPTGGGGPGGGAINLTVTGTLSLAGRISADGQLTSPGSANGAGSGGSVLLTLGTLAGNGLISANGGAADPFVGGGGGGGRVAVYFNTNQFTGSILAHGGAGAGIGGPGTVYVLTNGSPFGQLTIDNAGLPGITAFPSALSPVDLTISGGSTVSNFDGNTVSLRNLFIGSNSSLAPSGISSSGSALTITASNATLQAGGIITTDGDSTGGNGGGSSGQIGGGGGNAGYGGAGATNNAPGGTPSGSITVANTVGGSGGEGGGKGGGLVILTVAGTLQLNGSISANGLAGLTQNSGGGAGGSILLTVGTLSGAGTLSANGGAGNNMIGGGGSGGYLAIHYTTNQFAGLTQAHGGPGANAGGAGIVYFAGTSYQQLVLDNSGPRGALTPLSIPVDTIPDLTVTGGAVTTNAFSVLTLGNLLIGSNSVILAPFSQGPVTYTIRTNATIQAGGVLNGDGTGIGGFTGQNLNSTGGGGSYGGIGGMSASNAAPGNFENDSFLTPSMVGGRGGAGLNLAFGGNGGGNLRISVSGKLQLDGTISSQGVTGPGLNSGGGAGGSVWLTNGILAGSGLISVNGGAANGPAGGGGGGGRIAMYYNSNSFTGRFTAFGGAGANFGGAGTIYTARIGNPNVNVTQLTVDNGGAIGNVTPISSFASVANLTVTGGALLANSSSASLAFQNMLVGSNSTFVYSPSPQGSFTESITVFTNLTIQAGGKFIDDGASASLGGQTLNFTGGGGGHGGFGGNSLSNAAGGTALFDSISQPSQAGTRGGAGAAQAVGGNGGGVIFLTVNGTLQLDGRLSSDGLVSTAFNSGGGAGGGITLSAAKIAGAGAISANGGTGNNIGGGGGGGRIAISFKTNAFTGALTARGGVGGNNGGAGTIYLSPIQPSSLFPQLIVDNGGNRGTNTMISGISSLTDVSINSGAAAILPGGSQSWRSLTIASNGTLGTPLYSGLFETLTIANNLTIQQGGAIALDGAGFGENAGPGEGIFMPTGGGGGGHGGVGSSGSPIGANGGFGYDSITSPNQPGSGGGGFGPTSGSAGGGAMQLNVNGTLTVNGPITANGFPANTNGSGGGAGGSLLINAATLTGSAKISADGGNGDVLTSGGGGGGRIALYFNTDNFTGSLSARGGAGVSLAGGAGTIYLKTNSASFGQLFVDNAGAAGANTPLSSLSSAVALVLRNSAQADSTNPLTLQTLTINSAAAFNADSLAPLNLTVLGDALVDTNGAIVADAAGYSPAAGPGSGGVDGLGDGGGGGYGGAGGSSVFGASGGGTYGSVDQPTDFGSAGGTSPTVPNFSQGAGAIRLVVNGKLTLSGIISADGNNGLIAGSGGGSGGSIWITASILSGKGLITANGGAGESNDGGGGGGGRIAINPATNFFQGFAVAFGGDGANPGADGTVLVAPTFLISGSVLDTNGAPVAGVLLQPTGLAAVISDASGFYSVTVPPIWSGSITPTGNGIFLPNSLTYSGVSANATNQNFLIALPSSFDFTASQFDGTNNAIFNWYGINGVSYQPLCSSNLVDWTPYGSPIPGTNGPAMFQVPVSNAPQLFFRLSVTY